MCTIYHLGTISCAYSEFVFSDALWPDFERGDLEAALDEFEQRRRRFGAR